MKRLLFLTNIPAPYRIEFFNQLGHHVDLHVVFEARYAKNIKFRLDESKEYSFSYYFLFENEIKEKLIKFKVIKYLKKNWDEIFVTNYAYFTEMFALVYLKIKKIPYILELDGHTNSKESWLKYNFKKFLIKDAKLYFSPSIETDIYLMKYKVSKDAINRYHFTSINYSDIISEPLLEVEKRNLKIELGLKPKFTILMVGRLISIKGIDTFFKIAKEKSDYQFVFIGGLPDYKMAKDYGLEEIKNLLFINHITKFELRNYYQAADVFFFPTQKEPWGLVINEAMSQGLPIISTKKCTSAVELLKKELAEYICDYNDFDCFRLKIENYRKDSKLRKKHSYIALEEIKDYTIEKMVLAHLNSIGVLNE